MARAVPSAPILEPGKTCWRVAHAERVAFLVDADAYFSALRAAVLRARRTVLILGWDVDSRVRLVADDPAPDGYPATLLPFLNAVLADRPELDVHVLGWDFSMIYTFEREMLPAYKFAWRGHKRLHFALDSGSALWASHHQKIVVVDDHVAFCGGLDLTIRRWDTPDHASHDRRRVDPAGQPYPPMHDVQMVVDGDAAAALGSLARARWKAATGQALDIHDRRDDDPDPWPPAVVPDLAPAQVGIARTAADSERGPHIQEILALTLRAIAAARRSIFIEHQYLTSAAVGEALARRLEEPDGPEMVLILPRVESGWLEQSSLGVLRARLLSRLRLADRHGRLHVVHPVAPGLGTGCVAIHSKVMVIDDRLLKLGSANLSNRSMGLDTECDLVLEAPDGETSATGQAIARFRTRLLAEHLGVAPDLVEQRMAEHGLAGAIAWLRGGPRSLEPLEEGVAPVLNLTVFDALFCDPERPIAADKLIEQFVSGPSRSPAQRALLGLGGLLVALLAVVALWRLSPLASWVGADGVVSAAYWLREHPLAMLAIFVGGALAFFPGTLLVGATVLVYGSPRGALLAWAASVVASAVSYLMGRILPRHEVRGRWPAQMMWLRGQMRRRGVFGVALARLFPVGNSSVMNMVAGSLRVPIPRFLAATALGLVPGVLALSLFTGLVAEALRSPALHNVALVVALAGAVGSALWWLGRRLGRSAAPAPALAAEAAAP